MYKPPYDKLTIYEVESFHKELLSLLMNGSGDMEVDMSDVQKIDMAAIQLLISMAKSAKLQSRRFVLHALNPSHLETLALCGCEKLVGEIHE